MTAGKPPLARGRVEPGAPRRRVVAHEHILLILRLHVGALAALEYPTIARVLDVVVVLGEDHLLWSVQVLFAAIFLEKFLLLVGFEVLATLLVDLEHLQGLRRLRCVVDLPTLLVGVPREAHQLGQCLGVPGTSHEVVAPEGALLIILEMLQGIIAHGPRFGIVVSRVHIQVKEVFCGVLSDTQVPGRSPQFVVLGSHGGCGLVEVLHLLAQVLIIGGIGVTVGVGVRVGIAGSV
mmetsp:Transcript_2352/g.4966  ORF Transcript_2352/g.4966 Transcript_2352/m.4966 type:complete len:235 (-) Transcript_2352:808-1512(-)